MPPYLTHKDNTYYFRQSVPQELRIFIGKREIKKSLGHDYVRAISECKRYAVVADRLIAEARVKLDSIPIDPYSWEGIHRTRHVPLSSVTPELEQQFANLMQGCLLDTDRNVRIAGMDSVEFDDYGKHIVASISALRRQLAMGNVEPMLGTAHLFLVGRGYDPNFSDQDWRRIAYVLTQATLSAYEDMAIRQAGGIVKENNGPILPSQFEIQNLQEKSQTAGASIVTWGAIYDVWLKECSRPENTHAAYLAAMKLFNNFSHNKLPLEITIEDVLAYRDFLLNDLGRATGTVSNKIGFIATLYNAARNNAKLAKYIPHNPFEGIKIKKSKRGKAGVKRLPFSDAELKLIFYSPIFTQEKRSGRGNAREKAAAWISAIAYLTGIRLEQIATLHVRQFHVDAKGNHYIHTEDGKNENSTDRDVPIHSSLIEAGLLNYVQSCSGRLFPTVTCTSQVESKAFSQWYGRFLGNLKITSPSKVFHSFRHLFKDLCRNAGLEDSAIDQICGHEPGTVGGRYGVGLRIDILADLMTKIVPPVAIPLITPPKEI